MNDDFCLFVILTSLVALLLPPSGALIYLVFAGVLVSLAGVAGGIGRGEFPARPTATSPHDL
ncbi:MAG: hypothetical protein J2P20_04415 [Pseudonocardia sp.]|nr:hypothetical protein [Pseudonocardia sp.]MBO0875508.1 hypothetical protein [Pseudonocardia sp.]